jgi:hypothetical protein
MAQQKEEKTQLISLSTQGSMQVVPATNLSSLVQSKLLPAEQYATQMPDLGALQISKAQLDFVPDNKALTAMAVQKGQLLVLSKNIDHATWCKDNKVLRRRFDDVIYRNNPGAFMCTTKATRAYCLANTLQFPPCVVMKSTFEKGRIGSYRPGNEKDLELAQKKEDGMPEEALEGLKKALTDELGQASGYMLVSPAAWCDQAVAQFQVGGDVITTVWDPHWFNAIAALIGAILISTWRMYDETPPFDLRLKANEQPKYARVRRAGESIMAECDGFPNAPNPIIRNLQLAALMLIYNQDIFLMNKLFGVTLNVVNEMTSLKAAEKIKVMEQINNEVMALTTVKDIVLYVIKRLLLGARGDGSGTLIRFVHGYFEPGSITCFDNPPNVTDPATAVGRIIAKAQHGIHSVKDMNEIAPNDPRRKDRLAYWALKVWYDDDDTHVLPVNEVHIPAGNQVIPFAAPETYQANIAEDPLQAVFSWRLHLDGVRRMRPSVQVIDTTVGPRLSLLGDESAPKLLNAPRPSIPGLDASAFVEEFEKQDKEGAYTMSEANEAAVLARLDKGEYKAQESSRKAFKKVEEEMKTDSQKYAWARKRQFAAPISDAELLKAADPVSSEPSVPVSESKTKSSSPVRDQKKRKAETAEEPPKEKEKEVKKKQKTVPSSPAKELLKKTNKSKKLDRLDEQD